MSSPGGGAWWFYRGINAIATTLLPAAADLIHEGIQKSLLDAELEDCGRRPRR